MTDHDITEDDLRRLHPLLLALIALTVGVATTVVLLGGAFGLWLLYELMIP